METIGRESRDFGLRCGGGGGGTGSHRVYIIPNIQMRTGFPSGSRFRFRVPVRIQSRDL